MVIKTVYHFFDFNLGLEISSKKRGSEKNRGEFRKLFYQGRVQKTYLGEGRVFLGDQS